MSCFPSILLQCGLQLTLPFCLDQGSSQLPPKNKRRVSLFLGHMIVIITHIYFLFRSNKHLCTLLLVWVTWTLWYCFFNLELKLMPQPKIYTLLYTLLLKRYFFIQQQIKFFQTKKNIHNFFFKIFQGQEEVASVLLEHKASLTATTKKGFTPLHLAAKYGNLKVSRQAQL